MPQKEHSSLVFREFRKRLEQALEVRRCPTYSPIRRLLIRRRSKKTAKILPRLDDDTRIIPILDHLSQGFANGLSSASDYKSDVLGDGEGLSAENVNDLAPKHWPLCMRHLHDTLRKERHLKHYGRLQYGLFLKVG